MQQRTGTGFTGVYTPLLLRLSHGGRRAATENFGRFYKISAMRIVPARLHHQVVAVAGALFDKPAILHCAHFRVFAESRNPEFDVYSCVPVSKHLYQNAYF